MANKFRDIDSIAKANMTHCQYIEYGKYKRELIERREPDIQSVLEGYVWEVTEGY